MRDDLIGLILGCGCRARCCCADKPATPEPEGEALFQKQARTVPPPRAADESPFVPPPPQSFDSPQRPGAWGGGHLPGVDLAGRFFGEGGGGGETVFVLDDGSLALPGAATVVNHQDRTVRWVSYGAVQFSEPISLPLPIDVQLKTGEQNGVVYWKKYAFGGVEYGQETLFGSGTLQIVERSFDPNSPLTSTSEPFSATVTAPYIRLVGDYTNHLSYVGRGGTLYAKIKDPNGEIEVPITKEGYFYPASGASKYLVDMGGIRGGTQSLPAVPFSWCSPDGQVVVNGKWRSEHASLWDETGAALTLTAYGHALAGGSWAALCGPMLTEDEGEILAPVPWVLHERGGVITRLTPDGEVVQLPRDVFETEVLRIPAGTFRRFSPVGTLFNTWPPHWAFCECGVSDLSEVRALTLHDPWRDSVRGKPPEGTEPPAWWYWPDRPRKRPRVLPDTAPVAPLGLALADVLRADADTQGGAT